MTSFAELGTGARLFVASVGAAGMAVAAGIVALAPPPGDLTTLLFLGLGVVASIARVPLPVNGSLSLGYAFVLAALLIEGPGLSAAAALLSATASSIFPTSRLRRPRPHRVAFNAGLVGLSASGAAGVYVLAGGAAGRFDLPADLLAVLAYTGAFSVLNLGGIAIANHLAGVERAGASLRANFAWSVPGFLAGSSLAVLVTVLFHRQGALLLPLAIPFAVLVHLAYRARARQADELRRHSQQTATLYQSVTEALAMAIEAKDENTEEHVRRVQQLSLGIAARLRLGAVETEALRAASLLHDIGKIAVPEYILTKPGRLTAEEAEKMMIHPRVGAEILETVPFPYPLAPIVRHHHERWDGQGYPDRIAGTDIPIGARILAVVDCYDALTSDRPYRKALSREEALAYVRSESGRMFDPAVVTLLVDHIDELEHAMRELCPPPWRQAPPGASVPTLARPSASERTPFEEIVASQRELHALYDIARVVGHVLELDESLELLATKIGRLLPYRTLVVYLHDQSARQLVARFAVGEGAQRLLGFSIPVGERLSGWAALHLRAYIGRAHVNPLDRDGSRSDLEDFAHDPELGALRSSLVAPLLEDGEGLGVVALYHGATHSYSVDHRRVLLAVASHLAQAVRNGLRREPGATSLADPMTGLPNARALLLECGHRIARARDEDGVVGMLGLRVEGLGAIGACYGGAAVDGVLEGTAERLTSLLLPGEGAFCYGGGLLVVLAAAGAPAWLDARTEALANALRTVPLEAGAGVRLPVAIAAASASYPTDGATAEHLLGALEARLDGRELARLLPFPGRQSTGASQHETGGPFDTPGRKG